MDELPHDDWSLPSRIAVALQICGLDPDPHLPLSTLTSGQRTRAGLAALIFQKPDFLLLDEPTNNLDRGGRQLVIDLLRDWRGGAIVVSHDAAFLSRLGLDRWLDLPASR